jgi:hypothetical protein
MACHNLCTILRPPTNYRALLGLGLNFCPTPKFTTHNIQPNCERFQRDLYTKSFMAPNNKPLPKLFMRSEWSPPIHLVNKSLQRRTGLFIKRTKQLFVKKRSRSNLLPYQRHLLMTLRNNKNFVIINADKNLGPCIIERQQYIDRALKDHLTDRTTYVRVTGNDKISKMYHIKQLLLRFIDSYKKILPPEDIKFLKRTAEVKDPYPKFYLTAKVHKTPWKTRPIVSLSGSQLHGLGQWIDKSLQPFVVKLPSYVKSLFDLKEELNNLPPFPPNVKIGTADAVSMYTNIDTVHAHTEISKVLRLSDLSTPQMKGIIMHALHIVMNNNLFEFGDTAWLQIDGTAMGVSPSCCYAMLYFSPKEQEIRDKFPEILFLKRYIDDIFYIWESHANEELDKQRWHEFTVEINTYGKLKWEFTKLSKQQIFLDLTITLELNGKFSTTLYEKAYNPYLYLPPHSSHPKGSLRGLIYGAVHRIIRLTTSEINVKTSIQKLYERLLYRGYRRSLLLQVIRDTYKKLQSNDRPNNTRDQLDISKTIIMHLTYHPLDPPSNRIQEIFSDKINHPYRLAPLPQIKNHKNEEIGINRLLVAYHRPPNIGNLLSSRLIKADSGPLVSSYLD